MLNNPRGDILGHWHKGRRRRRFKGMVISDQPRKGNPPKK